MRSRRRQYFSRRTSFRSLICPRRIRRRANRPGLLDRAIADKNVPKIFFSNTSYEYWGRAAALIHVSADGKRDAAISDHVRIYHFTGLQHFSGPLPPARGQGDLLGQEPQSPLPIRFFWRAMIANMDAWVRSGTEPPPSSYPHLSDGTLVPLDKYAFPNLPGVNKPHEANEAVHLDFGPGWRRGILSLQPPPAGSSFPVLVPQVDADGNERDGIRLPEITVPAGDHHGMEPARSIDRRVRQSACRLRAHTYDSRRRRKSGRERTIRDRRSQSGIRASRIICDATPRHWTSLSA